MWAEVKPLKSWERLYSQQVQNVVTHKITIRYLAGLKANMRIVFGSRVFEIKGPWREDERRFWMFIDTEEQTDIEDGTLPVPEPEPEPEVEP